MGGFQAIQPVCSEEGIRPALMISPASTSSFTQAFAEEAAKPHPHPPVYGWKRGSVTVLELLKPAPQPRSEIVDDHSPEFRFVFARIGSLSFCMLLGRG